jgi:hypothetical protein
MEKSTQSQIAAIENAISSCEAEIKRLSELIETCEESRREALVKGLEYERTKEMKLREEKIGWIKILQHEVEHEVQFPQKGFC